MSRRQIERNAGLLHVAARRAGLAVLIDHSARRADFPHVSLHDKADPAAKPLGHFSSISEAIDWLGRGHREHIDAT